MAQYRPRQLSTLLCKLFDSGRCTVDQFATLASCTPEYIERLTNRPGTAIDGPTRHQIGGIISAFHRKFPDTRPPSEYEFAQHQLRIVTEAESDERKGTARGVGEEPDPPPGMRIFKSTDSRGEFVERREYLTGNLSKQLVRRILMGMEAYLDVVDPVEVSVTGDT